MCKKSGSEEPSCSRLDCEVVAPSLSAEYESRWAFHLLLNKLGFLWMRHLQSLENEPNDWAESGDCYNILKLLLQLVYGVSFFFMHGNSLYQYRCFYWTFLHCLLQHCLYCFHGSWHHVITALNKLDAANEEKDSVVIMGMGEEHVCSFVSRMLLTAWTIYAFNKLCGGAVFCQVLCNTLNWFSHFTVWVRT